MRKLLWVAGMAAASLVSSALVPAVTMAQSYGVKEATVHERPDHRGYWIDAGPDTLSREAWLSHAIKAAMDRGDLQENDGNRALAKLEVIHHDDVIARQSTSDRHDAHLNADDIQDRLDDLAHAVSFAIFHTPR
jgi:hypothetical protein